MAARFQFSLRALLVVFATVAVLCAVWNYAGASWAATAVFAAVSLGPVVWLPHRQRPNFALSYLAVYGPNWLIAFYTWLWISCDHCQAATRNLVPAGPGFVIGELTRRWMGLQRFADGLAFAIAVMISIAMVGVLTAIGRRYRWWSFVAWCVATVGSTVLAIGLLAAIRA